MNLTQFSAGKLKQMLDGGEITAREILLSVLGEIDNREDEIQAYLYIRDKDELLAEADEIDRRRSQGDRIGELGGLPIAVKDNICTKKILTTCASRILENFIPPYDAFVIERLRAADGIILGKTNMDEFAMGSSTEFSTVKVTHNPYNGEYVPGGSSGGSASAVAARETILALGSDTGGSIRQPASFCGIVGLKPTYGLVSRYGLIAYASSLDQIGTFSNNVSDAALMLKVIAAHDPKDSTSLDKEAPDYLSLIDENRSFSVGVPKEYFGSGLDQEVRQSVNTAIDLLKTSGHKIIPIDLPYSEYAIPVYYIIAGSEASSNLSRFDGVRYGYRAPKSDNILDMYLGSRSRGFGDEVKKRIMLGTYALSAGYYDAYYLKAAKVRTLIAADFAAAFKQCDVIAHPVAPTAAYKIGEKTADPLSMYLGDIYSVTANLAGLPAISIPCGLTKNRLPIGIQLAAKPLGETTLLSAAKKLESLLAAAQIWPSNI